MEKYNKLRLLNNEDKVLCSIDCVTYYDENNEFDEGETYYLHPMTNDRKQTIAQCLVGWSEQDIEENLQWESLINSVENDIELTQKIFDIDNIDYYI